MTCREEIKYLLLKKRMTLTKLAEEMSKISGRKISQSFLSQKLANQTLRYYELELICQILGYKITFDEV